MSEVFEKLDPLDSSLFDLFDADCGFEARNSPVERIDRVGKSHVIFFVFSIIAEQVVVEADVEDVGVHDLIKRSLVSPFEEAFASLNILVEARIPFLSVPFSNHCSSER